MEFSKGVQVQIEKGDKVGINLRLYAEKGYDSQVLKQLRRAIVEDTDITDYVEEGYDGEQLREIRVALKQGVMLESYLEEGFCGAQLRQIRKGLRHFVDIRCYTDTRYNWLQMREMRLGLQNRIDATVYANPFYSYRQMREIRLGLEDGLDVSSYARLLYSCMDMHERRKQLLKEQYANELKWGEMSITDEGSELEIHISGNRMEAYIILPKEHRKQNFTVDYVEKILKRNGVVYGLLRDEIEQALEENKYDERILVAKGKKPRTGDDGRYEFYFNTDPSREPAEMDDGRVDYQSVNIFEEVQQGQTIAKYIPSQKGRMGTDVRGYEVPGLNGKELPLLDGSGFKILEDGVTYIAAIPGIIEFKNNEIQIFESLIIREDVNASYGNIRYHGCVHIYGNVGSNVEVSADGSITVEGTVEAANIISKRDVLIKNGMAGAGKGTVVAGGNIAGNFFEASHLEAEENIEAGYLMNSESVAQKRVITKGKRGSIIGGKTRSVYGIEANRIGNRSQLRTDVEVGASQELLQQVQEYQDEYERLQSEILDLMKRMSKFSGEDRESVVFKNLQKHQSELREQAEEVREKRNKAQDVVMADITVDVQNRAYAGTRITISQAFKKLEEDCKMTTFYMENHKVKER